MFQTQINDLVTFQTTLYAILCTRIGLRLGPGRKCLSLIPSLWLLALCLDTRKGNWEFHAPAQVNWVVMAATGLVLWECGRARWHENEWEWLEENSDHWFLHLSSKHSYLTNSSKCLYRCIIFTRLLVVLLTPLSYEILHDPNSVSLSPFIQKPSLFLLSRALITRVICASVQTWRKK
jgi:hypothetical protein